MCAFQLLHLTHATYVVMSRRICGKCVRHTVSTLTMGTRHRRFHTELTK